MKDLLEFLREETKQLDYIISFSIIGSATSKKKTEKNDEIDLYLIMDKATQIRLDEINSILFKAKIVIGSEPYIEMRRGPLNLRDAFQFHLIVDDLNSVKKTSSITLADWENNSILIHGAPISSYISIKELTSSFRSELCKTLGMVAGNFIIYKEWAKINGVLTLVENTKKIDSLEGYMELIKYSYKAMRSDYVALNIIRSNSEFSDSKLEHFTIAYKLGLKTKFSIERLSELSIDWNRELLKTIC